MATDTWNIAYEADPDDTDLANLYANRLRNTKLNIRERMELDHEWEDATTGGKHNKVTLLEQGAAPTPGADEFGIYAKVVSAKAELFFKNEDGTETQITSLGSLVLDDHSATDAEQATEQDPGISGAQVNAVSIEEEIETIRYALAGIVHGRAGRNTTDSAGWFDRPARGVELAANPAFLDDSAAAAAPIGYALVGTPSTIVPETLDATEGAGNQINIAADAGPEGIQQTYAGLKASAYYRASFRIKPTVGTWKLVTTGADGAVFGDLDISSSGSGWQTISGIIITDSTPTDIVVQLVSSAGADQAKVAYHSFKECSFDIGSRIVQNYYRKTGSDQTGDFGNGIANAALHVDTVQVVVVPGPGYKIVVHGIIQAELAASGDGTVEIQEEVDGGGFVTVVARDVAQNGGVLFEDGHPIIYVRENPTPGSLYGYQLHTEGGGILTMDAVVTGDNHILEVNMMRT